MSFSVQETLRQPWVWGLAVAVTFSLCTFLPIWIKNDKIRKAVNWFVLIPVSLVIILYVYPMGIELFRMLAVNWR